MDFTICYPDANTIDSVIKVKSLEDFNAEYFDLGEGIGYWIADNPFYDNGFELFKGVVKSFPIVKDNNAEGNLDPNPFDTIHLPDWTYKHICFLLRDFYLKHVQDSMYDPQIHEWGNVYYKERAKPISCWRIPHVDYPKGLVGNLWFTGHDLQDSCTKLYKYNGTVKDSLYDFQTDKDHPMHKRWSQIADNPQRADAWFNMSNDELAEWGFKYMGSAPSVEGKMTMYKADISHAAVISSNVDFRWSHTFAFSDDFPPEVTMGDLGIRV